MALAILPYPSMDFVPLDVLTADELDQIVANIDAINNATIGTGAIDANAITTAKIDDGAITTAKVANDAITQAKIDMASATTATSITITDYFTPATGWTFTGQMWKLGHFVFGTIESSHSININQNNIGTCSSHILYGTYGAGRVGDGSTSYAATALAIPNGQLRLHATHAGTSCAFTICVYVDN